MADDHPDVFDDVDPDVLESLARLKSDPAAWEAVKFYSGRRAAGPSKLAEHLKAENEKLRARLGEGSEEKPKRRNPYADAFGQDNIDKLLGALEEDGASMSDVFARPARRKKS